MAAISKDELCAVSRKEYEKLEKLLAGIDDAAAGRKDSDDTSIKDVVAHRAHWIDLFFGWYRDGLAGKEVHFPAKGYKWSELKRYNADLRAKQVDLTWADAQAMLARRYKALMKMLNDLDEKDLYGGPMQGARNYWPPGRWAEAVGPSHFRSAGKYIRKALKAAA